MKFLPRKLSTWLVLGAMLLPGAASAAETTEATDTEPRLLELAGGRLQLSVPASWKEVKPRSRIVQHEFSVPAAGEDQTPGRMTIMAASGGLEANIARWVGQFRTAAGEPLAEDAKHVEKMAVGDLEVHQVDLSGDYQDKPGGPFGPSVNRPNYRMLAAIVPTKAEGTWFIKLYGPQATITAAKKRFDEMISGINWKSE